MLTNIYIYLRVCLIIIFRIINKLHFSEIKYTYYVDNYYKVKFVLY